MVNLRLKFTYGKTAMQKKRLVVEMDSQYINQVGWCKAKYVKKRSVYESVCVGGEREFDVLAGFSGLFSNKRQ